MHAGADFQAGQPVSFLARPGLRTCVLDHEGLGQDSWTTSMTGHALDLAAINHPWSKHHIRNDAVDEDQILQIAV